MNLLDRSSTERILYGYRLVEAVRETALGTQYTAVEAASGRMVSVTVLAPICEKDPILSRQLRRHSSNLVRLRHPNIVRVLAFREGVEGTLLVQEYVEGVRLDRYLSDRTAVGWHRALRYVRQILSALVHAHALGVLHEGLSPSGVMITGGNIVKIGDFGLNRIVREHSYLSVDREYDAKSLAYLAPEQQEAFGAATVASDLYALGLLAYEMMAGRNPQEALAQSYFTRARVPSRSLRALRDAQPTVPEHVSRVVMKALCVRKDRRYRSAEAMLADLKPVERVMDQTPGVIYPRGAWAQRVGSLIGKRGWYGIGSGLLGVLLLTFYFQVRPRNLFVELETSPMPPLAQAQGEAGNLQSVAALSGASQVSVATLRLPEGDSTYLVVESRPEGAEVRLNGRSIGKSPVRVEPLEPGKANLVLSLPGYAEVAYEAMTYDDHATTVSFSLEPETSLLFLAIEPWGTVYLDGRLLADRIEGDEALMISKKRHTLSISHPEYGQWERSIDPFSDEALDFAIDFRQQVPVSVMAYDMDRQEIQGEIIVDGIPIGYFTPTRFSLPVGLHTVEVQATGYQPVRGAEAINFEGPREAPLEFKLQKRTDDS